MTAVAPRNPGPLLVLGRAAVLGAVGFGSGIASHVAGGGRLPSGIALLCLLAISVAVSAHLVRTWASSRRLVMVVVVTQGAWHLVLSLLAGHAATVPSTPPTSGSGQGVVGHQLAHLGEQGAAMVLAHLGGAVALGLFLARGEAALRGLVDLLGTTVGSALLVCRMVPATPVSSRAGTVTHVEPVHRSGRIVRDSTRRRGPPLLLVA